MYANYMVTQKHTVINLFSVVIYLEIHSTDNCKLNTNNHVTIALRDGPHPASYRMYQINHISTHQPHVDNFNLNNKHAKTFPMKGQP